VGAYTPGVVLWLSPETLPLADYVAVSEGAIRHDPTSLGLQGFFASRQPVHTVYLDGIPYVRIYALTDAPRRWLSWQLPAVQHPRSTMLGRNMSFQGYDGNSARVAAGDTLALSLYWQCTRPLSVDYTVFVKLIDPQTGQAWGQWDSIPVHGRFPTSWWLPGLVIRDDVTVTVQAATPPGEYELHVGMYNVKTGKRLWVDSHDSSRDTIVLDPVTVTASGGAP
jgi:hypothetical protein